MKGKITFFIFIFFIGSALLLSCVSNAIPTIIHGYRISTSLFEDSRGYSEFSTFKYNKNGKLIEKKCKTSEGYSETFTYKYDDKGNEIERNFKTSDGRSSTFSQKYNEDGDLIEKHFKDSNGSEWKITYEFNINLIYEVYENKSNQYKSEKTYEYNCSGNLLKYTFLDNAGYTEVKTITYTERNHKIKEEYSNSNGKNYIIDFVYNSYNLLEMESFTGSEKSYKIVYSYNEKGRCAKSEYKDSKGVLHIKFFEYYENNVLKSSEEYYKDENNENNSYKSKWEYLENGLTIYNEFISINNSYIVSYEYDENDRIKKMEYNVNNVLETIIYEYDEFDNLVKEYSRCKIYSYSIVYTYEVY